MLTATSAISTIGMEISFFVNDHQQEMAQILTSAVTDVTMDFNYRLLWQHTVSNN